VHNACDLSIVFFTFKMAIGEKNYLLLFVWMKSVKGVRSQWPCGLRRRSAAARLLRLCVRIPPGACMFVVSVTCCELEVSATNRSLVQRSLTACGVSLCVIVKPRQWGGHGLLGAVAPKERNKLVKCRLTKWSSLRRVLPIERLKRIKWNMLLGLIFHYWELC
jgi:hypothetical protein